MLYKIHANKQKYNNFLSVLRLDNKLFGKQCLLGYDILLILFQNKRKYGIVITNITITCHQVPLQ